VRNAVRNAVQWAVRWVVRCTCGAHAVHYAVQYAAPAEAGNAVVYRLERSPGEAPAVQGAFRCLHGAVAAMTSPAVERRPVRLLTWLGVRVGLGVGLELGLGLDIGLGLELGFGLALGLGLSLGLGLAVLAAHGGSAGPSR
jgi:hypothetical protein